MVLSVLIAAAAAPAFAAGGGHGGGGHGGGGSYYNLPPTMGRAPSFHIAPPPRPIFGPNVPANISGGPVFDLRGHDFHRFTPSERTAWTHGRWYHGRYFGRAGWWWFAAGFWYWYEEPLYPYPDYVSGYVEADIGNTYYYCSDPEGYYPDVTNCNVAWVAVPAMPPQ